ncbi:MAG: flagellar export chaperone FliS [Burkholderiales bacterium]|nr:flagellar export chaperone FliS [Burkholderiales bacterium]
MFTAAASRSAAAYNRVGVETSVGSADPHKLVSLLFDGLLQALGSARVAMQGGDIALKGRKIGVAVRILEEGLIAPLNLEEGGELAANLNALYRYCVTQVTLANVRNDASGLAEVSRLIELVASGWKQIDGTAPAYSEAVAA